MSDSSEATGVGGREAIARMREALELADAMLSGANMNARVVERKVREALATQAQAEPTGGDRGIE